MEKPDNDLSAELLAMQILSGPNLDGWQTGEEHRDELHRQYAELHPEVDSLRDMAANARLWEFLGPGLDWYATQQADNTELWQKLIETNPEILNLVRRYPLAEWRDNYIKKSPEFRKFVEDLEEEYKNWREFQEWRAQQ